MPYILVMDMFIHQSGYPLLITLNVLYSKCQVVQSFSCPLTIRKLVKILVIEEYVLKADVIELLKKLEDRLGLMDGQ